MILTTSAVWRALGASFDPPSIRPQMGPENYRTYTVLGRRHKVTCERYGCPRYERGWLTLIDESTELGQRQAAYIRTLSGRRFRERVEGGLTHFEFYPEQTCFEEHFMSLEEDPRFLRMGGDYRGDPRGEGVFQHRNMDDWVNDLGDHQDGLRRAQS